MEIFDVIILGGGAAGLFCAAEAAQRGRKVLVLESGVRFGPKILVSGGGRCNFTNLHAQPSDYVTTNPSFVPPALSRFQPKDFISLVKNQKIPYHEKKDGQLFCDKSAKAIIDLLLARLVDKDVSLLKGQKVEGVSWKDKTFTVTTLQASYAAPKLVVATGGLSWPQLGASDLGYRIAIQFGLTVIPQAPALVGLTFTPGDLARFDGLSGVHLNVSASCGDWKMQEDIMITHKGLSGPIMLNASLHWRPGQEITLNWIPEGTMGATYKQLLKEKTTGKMPFKPWLSERLPKSLAARLAYLAGARGNWAELSDEQLKKLAQTLHAYRFVPADTFGYGQAEVTRGGVDTRELSPQTMECLKVPGLYFIGEVMDVTGKLGGFNFQWAWASAYAAGQGL